MFVRSLQQRFAQLFAGYRDREQSNFCPELARKFIRESRAARAVDYVYNFNIDGTAQEKTLQTRARWFFIMTNAAVWFDETSGAVFPQVEINFPDGVGSTPFGTERDAFGSVPSKLVFAMEGRGRFEEYKNLFYVMGERVSMRAKVTPPAGSKFHGAVLLSGVEIDLGEGFENG